MLGERGAMDPKHQRMLKVWEQAQEAMLIAEELGPKFQVWILRLILRGDVQMALQEANSALEDL